jgi:hypothetical protein
MIDELEQFWIEKTTDLSNLYKLRSSAFGSDNSNVSFRFGKFEALLILKTVTGIEAKKQSFKAQTNDPEIYFENIQGADFGLGAKQAVDELVSNWMLHSNSSKHFMDRQNAQN